MLLCGGALHDYFRFLRQLRYVTHVGYKFAFSSVKHAIKTRQYYKCGAPRLKRQKAAHISGNAKLQFDQIGFGWQRGVQEFCSFDLNALPPLSLSPPQSFIAHPALVVAAFTV